MATAPAVSPDFNEALRRVPTLSDLNESEFAWLAQNTDQLHVAPGEAYVREGEPAEHLHIILEGEVRARSESNARADQPVFTAQAGTITGLLPFSRMTLMPRTARAVTPTWIARLHKSKFPEMVRRVPCLGERLVWIMSDRIREVAITEQQNEKLVALGKLSAGLAHHLNNPGAALARTADGMDQALHRLLEANVRLDELPLRPEQRRYLACAERETVAGLEMRCRLEGLARTDREEAIGKWLNAHRIPNAFAFAPALVELDWSDEDLHDLASRFDCDSLQYVLARLIATADVGRLLAEIRASTARVSQLIRTMHEYSYLDQNPEQEVDVHDGIENTLTLLSHRFMPDIVISREYDRTLPCVLCHARALNQVWTNLIENSLDALAGHGEITLRTTRDGESACISIADNGPGIPPEAQSHVFEPFFTTKPLGSAVGLGLDTVFRIVRQHRGEVTIDSKPGRTEFRVRIPLKGPHGI